MRHNYYFGLKGNTYALLVLLTFFIVVSYVGIIVGENSIKTLQDRSSSEERDLAMTKYDVGITINKITITLAIITAILCIVVDKLSRGGIRHASGN